MPRISLNGFELYYEERGTGAPVIYVHGGFPSLDMVLRDLQPYDWTWENDFAAQFRFITYDRRGCYRSSCPDDGYDLLNQAHDLECLLSHLQVGSVHLIGSSAGGPIALVFAATRTSCVRSLILAGTALDLFPRGDPAGDLLREHVRLLEEDGAESAFEKRPEGVEVTLRVLWEPEEAEERGTIKEYWDQHRKWAEQAMRLPKAQRIQYYAAELKSIRAYMDVDLSAYARQVTVPTLVLHGSNDREVPLAWAEALARTLGTAQLHILKGQSHSVLIRSSEARKKAISFIEQFERDIAAA